MDNNVTPLNLSFAILTVFSEVKRVKSGVHCTSIHCTVNTVQIHLGVYDI